MLRHLTNEARIIALAALALEFLLIWFFAYSDKSLSDILINVITDLIFAIFIVLLINRTLERDRRAANRGREMAVALAAQAIYQTGLSMLGTFIEDGIQSTNATSLPDKQAIISAAASLGKKSEVSAEFETQPIPYAAYFFRHFTGHGQANVYPSRLSAEFLGQLGQKIDPLYHDMFNLDKGSIPDDVVSAVTALKNHHIVRYADILSFHRAGVGFWPEEDLYEFANYLDTISNFFSPILNYTPSVTTDKIRDIVINALTRQRRTAHPSTQS